MKKRNLWLKFYILFYTDTANKKIMHYLRESEMNAKLKEDVAIQKYYKTGRHDRENASQAIRGVVI